MFVKAVEDIQIFATAVDVVYIAGMYHKLNYLLNMMSLNYYQLLKIGMGFIKQEIQKIVNIWQVKINLIECKYKLRRGNERYI